MLSTLFFDSSRQGAGEAVKGSVHVERQRHLTLDPSRTWNSESSPSSHNNRISFVYPSFSSQGTVQVLALHASLSWWLDCSPQDYYHTDLLSSTDRGRFQNPRIVLFSTNDNQSEDAAKSCQNDLLTLEIPLRQNPQRGTAVLGCGISKQAQGGNLLAVTWITNTLEVGFVMVSVHRESPNGRLYLHTTTPGGSIPFDQTSTEGAPHEESSRVVDVDPVLQSLHGHRSGTLQRYSQTELSSVLEEGYEATGGGSVETYTAGGGSTATMTGSPIRWGARPLTKVIQSFSTTQPSLSPSGRNTQQSAGAAPAVLFSYRHVTATVIAEVPESQFTQQPNLIAYLILTDGVSLWRVELSRDGSMKEFLFEDPFLKEVDHLERQFFSSKKSNSISEQLQRYASQSTFRYGTALLNPIYYEDLHLHQHGSVPNLHTSSAPREAVWRKRREEILQALAAQANEDGVGSNNSSPFWSRLKSLTGAGGADRSRSTASLKLDFHKSKVGGRYYLALCAVQESSYFLLCRANGYVEVFRAIDFSASDIYPMGAIPQDLQDRLVDQYMKETVPEPNGGNLASLPPLPLFGQQWASRDVTTNGVHFFLSLGLQSSRYSAVGVIPQVEASEALRVVLRNAYNVRPPTLTSTPMGCSFIARREPSTEEEKACSGGYPHKTSLEVALLWDRGVEEEAMLTEGYTVGSLFAHTRESLSFLQLLQARLLDYEKELEVLSATCFAGQGLRSPLAAVFSSGAMFYTMEWTRNIIRAHALRSRFTSVEEYFVDLLVESINIDNDDDNQSLAGQNLRLVTSEYGIHWVPCMDDVSQLTNASSTPTSMALRHTFFEGVGALEATGLGASLLVDLLQEALQGVPGFPSVPRLLSEDLMSGYVPTHLVSEKEMWAALCRVLEPLPVPPPREVPPSFCAYSRHYVLHAVSTALLRRVASVILSYIGWRANHSAEPAHHPVERVCSTVVEVLVAGYHASLAAGADLALLAELPYLRDDEYLDTDTVVFSVLNRFLPSAESVFGTSPASVVDGEEEEELEGDAPPGGQQSLLLFGLQTAAALRYSGSESCAVASSVYSNALRARLPLLQHFLLLRNLDGQHSVRTTTTVVRQSIRLIPTALTRLSEEERVIFLLHLGGFPLQGSGAVWCPPERRETFLQLLSHFLTRKPQVASDLYLVGLLRRVISFDDSQVICRVNESLLDPLLLALSTLLSKHLLVASGEEENPPPLLVDAFRELQIETLLCLSMSCCESLSLGQSAHYLEEVLSLLPHTKASAFYENGVETVVGSVIEVACMSVTEGTDSMEQLVKLSTLDKRLDEKIVARWNHFIVRIPTGSADEATEALRRHAILGLYQYLMNRRSFAQCGRIFSDLASLLRSSTQRKVSEHYLSVGELADMALHAVELIHTEAPLETNTREEGADHHHQNGLTASEVSEASSSSWCSSDPLRCTRKDLPWLRRRAFQAHCERHLWWRNCSVECTDLWIDHLPEVDYLNSLRRLVDALMDNRLWREAYHLTLLADQDAAYVLCLWAVDLLQNGRVEMKNGVPKPVYNTYHEWTQLIDYCKELADLQPKHTAVKSIPFRRVLMAAFLCEYRYTPRRLLDAFAAVDLYGCTITCLNICTNLRVRGDSEAPNPKDDATAVVVEEDDKDDLLSIVKEDSESEEEEEGVTYKDYHFSTSQWRSEVLPWLVLLETNRLGLKLLRGEDSKGRPTLPVQTAQFDTIARYNKELLAKPNQLFTIQKLVPDTANVLKDFLYQM